MRSAYEELLRESSMLAEFAFNRIAADPKICQER